jgi:hypothetical protein
MVMAKKEVQYDKISVIVREASHKLGELTVEEAKTLIGWTTEEEAEEEYGVEYKLRDPEGNKVRLLNNPTNRPFRKGLALRYANEILRGKWAFNGETMVFDRYGNCQEGQHRMCGFIMAEMLRKKNVEHWKAYGHRGPITIPCLLVFGISDKPEVVDTLNLGQKRSLGDVIFRNQDFGEMSEREQKKLANVLAGALRLAWLRVGGRLVSDAPHFPHSEALDFQDAHPRIQDAVNFIFNEDGGTGEEGKKISRYISMGYAAALMYLMGTSKTNPDEYAANGAESIDYSLWAKAEKFWTIFGSGVSKGSGDLFHSLRTKLDNIDASGAMGRDEVCGTVVKAFVLWLEKGDKAEAKPKDITVKRGKNDAGQVVLTEEPRLGGLDVAREHLEEDEETEGEGADDETNEDEGEEKKPKAAKKKAAKKPRKSSKPTNWVGEWAWVVDEKNGHWKGKVKSVDGATAVVTAEEDSQDYSVEVSALSADKPE